MIRVATLLEFPTLLGGERSWLSALEAMEGVSPLAVAPAAGPLADALARRGIPHLPFPWPSTGPEDRAARIADLLRAHPPDLVHANSLTTALCAGALGRALGVPSVGHCRDIMRLSAARVARIETLDRVVAVSAAVAADLNAQGVTASRIAVVRNGIDARGRFDPSRVPDRLREQLELDPGTPVVGFVGQIVQRKDPLTFVRAVRSLGTRFPALRGVVVGARHSRKDEALAYEDAVRREGGGRVVFTGESADAPSLLRGMTVVVSSSRQDPLSRVLLEALALERPVVATDVGGTRELVRHGDTGLLVPPGDAGAVADALARLLENPAEARSLAARGRRHILENFTPGQCARGILAVYRAVLAKGPIG